MEDLFHSYNIIEFTFASQGNTQDFGDSTNTRAGAPITVSMELVEFLLVALLMPQIMSVI